MHKTFLNLLYTYLSSLFICLFFSLVTQRYFSLSVLFVMREMYHAILPKLQLNCLHYLAQIYISYIVSHQTISASGNV